ncbi:MAG: dihydrolipoyl dehydrogenase [Thermodesulfobacteriota bacterium]
MEEKEIVIIGGGPGGYVAAIRSAQLGCRVTLIEKEELGGTCLNWGCIPTKALLRGVEILENLRHAAEFGIQMGEVKIDFLKLMARKDRAVKTIVSGVTNLLKTWGVEVIKGKASLLSPKEIEVFDQQGEKRKILAKKLILAPGSIPAELPFPGRNLSKVIDSQGALQLKRIPHSIVIIGAGPIGLEFGTIFTALGSKVTIIEMRPQILPQEDEEIASALERILKRNSMQINLNCLVKEISESQEGAKEVRAILNNREEKLFTGEYVLIAGGRQPNLEELGVEKAGIKVGPKGIEVNEKMETNIPGIYAVGDVTGQILLAHFAMAQGVAAAENAVGREVTLKPRVVPRCIYTLPEVAAVGLTEEEAKKAGYDLKIGHYPFAANGKATAMGERNGFVKVIAEKKYGEVLGIHILGPQATDLIGEAILAMRLEATAQDIAHTIHPHPTLSEALMEAALDVNGEARHLPPPKKTKFNF